MTKDCPVNYQFSTCKFQAQNTLRTCFVPKLVFCFDIQNNLCTHHVLKIYLQWLMQVGFSSLYFNGSKELNAWSADKNWACFWKIMCFRNDRNKYCGRDLMRFKIEFKLILDEQKSNNTF